MYSGIRVARLLIILAATLPDCSQAQEKLEKYYSDVTDVENVDTSYPQSYDEYNLDPSPSPTFEQVETKNKYFYGESSEQESPTKLDPPSSVAAQELKSSSRGVENLDLEYLGDKSSSYLEIKAIAHDEDFVVGENEDDDESSDAPANDTQQDFNEDILSPESLVEITQGVNITALVPSESIADLNHNTGSRDEFASPQDGKILLPNTILTVTIPSSAEFSGVETSKSANLIFLPNSTLSELSLDGSSESEERDLAYSQESEINMPETQSLEIDSMGNSSTLLILTITLSPIYKVINCFHLKLN
jgi:hypothetical protein